MKKMFLYLLLATCYLSLVTPAYAEYVLPYPSYMPGNKLYKASRIVDRLKEYWYFGNVAKVTYHLSLSDKYLVEAKTLFEYKQYVLAEDALGRSTQHARAVIPYLDQAKKEGKDVSPLAAKTGEAMSVHADTLARLSSSLPTEFFWRPEKDSAELLTIGRDIQNAIEARTRISAEIAPPSL